MRDPKFSPSAKKFHYQFNLRDLAKIIEGLTRSTPKEYKDQPLSLYKLWAHECQRTFEDRFINKEDITVFKKYLSDSFVNKINGG